MQPSQQQPPASIEINPQAQYIPHNQFGQQVVYTNTGQQIVVIGKPPQNGLITASYICSAIGLLVLPFLGPIGFVLALMAQKNGDNRGKGCHDIRWRCDTTIANDNRVIIRSTLIITIRAIFEHRPVSNLLFTRQEGTTQCYESEIHYSAPKNCRSIGCISIACSF